MRKSKRSDKTLEGAPVTGEPSDRGPEPGREWDGNIDRVDGSRVAGWLKARDSDAPQVVDVYVDGVCMVAGCVADRFRSDLAEAGFGDGHFGFDVRLGSVPDILGDAATVAVRAAGEATEALSGTFIVPPWEAHLEGLDGRRVYGWLKKRGDDKPQAIDVYLDDTCVVAGHVADSLREDARAAGHGDGYFGFDLIIASAPHIADAEVTVSIRNPVDGYIVASATFPNASFGDSYSSRIDTPDEDTIVGWCVNRNRPDDAFDVDVYLDGLFYISIKNDVVRPDLKDEGLSNGLGGLSFGNPAAYMDDGPHSMVLSFPDGSVSSEYSISTSGRTIVPVLDTDAFPRRGVTIIVPIYNAPDDVEVCIERLLAYTPSYANMLLIDDCSSDHAVGSVLSKHEGAQRVRILRNPENRGFTRTVNRGIAEAGRDDVILLNSDARVTPGWLEGILVAAYSSPRIATVTAMSDRAGAFSAPQAGNENALPDGVDEITFSRAFRRRSLGLYPRVPTGNGFCMYVNRECLDSVGPLDAEAFPRGYGEENDFCMRALRAGWRNIIDDRTYVFHARAKSFGEAKKELLLAGRAVVDARYPEYKKAISIFGTSQEIALARYRARQALQDCADGRELASRVLFVVSTTTGGTPQTNGDLMEALSGGLECWTLRCDSRVLELSRISDGETSVVRTHVLQEPIDPIQHRSRSTTQLSLDGCTTSISTWCIFAILLGTACHCLASPSYSARESSSLSTTSIRFLRPSSWWTTTACSLATPSKRRVPVTERHCGHRTRCRCHLARGSSLGATGPKVHSPRATRS